MDVGVTTLRYLEGMQGFPVGALRIAFARREVLEVRDHFFDQENVPHMARDEGRTGAIFGDSGKTLPLGAFAERSRLS